MPKAKGARLSLTLPGPLDANDRPAKMASPHLQDDSDTQSPRGTQVAAEPAHMSSSEDISPHPLQGKPSTEIPPEPMSPYITSLPPVPVSPKHSREQSRSLFSNVKAAKSSAKIPGSDLTRQAGDSASTEKSRQASSSGRGTPSGQGQSREGSVNASKENLGINTQVPPELSRVATGTPGSGFRGDEGSHIPSRLGSIPPYSSRSLPKSVPGTPQTPGSKKPGSMFGFMKRNPSNMADEYSEAYARQDSNPHSRDRSAAGGNDGPAFNPLAANDPKQVLHSHRSGFLKALKTGTNKAKSGYKKGREKFLRGSNRPIPSPTPPLGRQSVDPDYEMQIITRPLLDQVRLTRIAPRLEQSRDKTEFWLPSLPWRCIDYLNFKGVEEEGIYRHSGSQIQINYYKQKFDRERDVDLYEEADLYDVNTVSSLLKAWFRELPDELFPSSLQEALVARHPDTSSAPEELKETISNLEPWRYYLLFAITCHLSLITASSDKNKMNVENLHTCIGRSLRIERVVFIWLVDDWRNCWIGCAKEKEYLDAEYAWLEDETAQLEGDSSNPPSRQSELSGQTLIGLHGVRAPSPGSTAGYRAGSNDSRLGSSSSRQNMTQEISYVATAASQTNIPPAQLRHTGSRKPSQPDISNGSRSFSDRMQQQAAVARETAFSSSTVTGRERSPVGRRPARPDRPEASGASSRGAGDERARTHRRAQSQPRSDNSQQRGKSPSSSGGRRRRGETTTGHSNSPANRSPSQGSDQFYDASNGGAGAGTSSSSNTNNSNNKNVSGRRRREGSEAPEMPVMSKERLESLQREGGGGNNHSRKGSATAEEVARARDRDRDRDVHDMPPQLAALNLGSDDGRDSSDLGFHEAVQDQDAPPPATPQKKVDSKFRLSEPKFPDPISPFFTES